MSTHQTPNCNEELCEIVCDKCGGSGAIEHNSFELMDYMCPKCGGSGKVDWITNVIWADNSFNLKGLENDDHPQYFM